MSDWYEENSIIGLGSVGYVDQAEVFLVSPRPMGYMADIDRKPVYRVAAKGRKI